LTLVARSDGSRAIPADVASTSLEALFAACVRREIDDALRAALAPLLARLDALTAAAPPSLVTVDEAARRLQKSPARIRAMAAAGDLPACRVGRSWRIDLAAVRPVPVEQVVLLAADARRIG
jgi:excisionase family DNA binding protein